MEVWGTTYFLLLQGIGGVGNSESGLYQKQISYGHADDMSPLGNGSPPASRDPTPVPPLNYPVIVYLDSINLFFRN